MQTLTTQQLELSALLTRNQQRLEYEETAMKNSLRTFAASLKSIRDSGCWKVRGDPYESFSDYCRKKLKMSEQRASQIITSAGAIESLTEAAGDNTVLKEVIESLPEGSIRQLKNLPVKKAVGIIKKLSADGGKVSPLRIKHCVDPASAAKCCPTCGRKYPAPSTIPD